METVKFTFNNEFESGRRNPQAQRKTSAATALDTARVEAQTLGIEEGRTQAFAEIENSIAQSLAAITETASALFKDRETSEVKIREEATQLAYAISAKLAPALIKAKPMAEIEALVGDCLTLCQREARIVVRVHSDMVDPLSKQLESLTLSNGFQGDVVLLADTSLGPADCRVEWPDGGAERNLDEIMSEIETIVQRFVNSGEQDHLSPPMRDAQTLGE